MKPWNAQSVSAQGTVHLTYGKQIRMVYSFYVLQLWTQTLSQCRIREGDKYV